MRQSELDSRRRVPVRLLSIAAVAIRAAGGAQSHAHRYTMYIHGVCTQRAQVWKIAAPQSDVKHVR